MTSKREWQRRAEVAEWEAAVQTRLAEKRTEYHRAFLDAMICLAERTAERDRARDIAARLEGELARVRDVVTAWSLGETGRDEMVLWAIREIVGLTPARPETPTPWPHFDAEVAP